MIKSLDLNKIILFFYQIYFKAFRINDEQSLEYQVLISFMFIHKLTRKNLYKDVGYIGTNEISFNEKELKKAFNFVEKMISKIYREILEKLNDRNKKLYFLGILRRIDKEEYLKFKLMKNKNKNEYYIIMTSQGYSYQYNGYKKSDVRLQETANLFALFTILGGIFIWLENSENKILYLETKVERIYTLIIYIFIFLLYLFRKKRIIWKSIILLIILTLIVV
jgi:hypothetical protein